MRRGIIAIAAAAAVSALCCVPAYASVKITTVTNDSTTTNGCTLRSVAGYGGYGFNDVVWGVDCPNDPEVYPERVDHWSDWGGNWCEMKIYTAGYSLSGGCGNYSIYRN